ncbi:MAG: thiamine pyrophosphate-dependent enzyme, partial [Clostridia bacterium]|nr:thiamine pyrophosphate-dependent enzyme [Clostridia bacterium]
MLKIRKFEEKANELFESNRLRGSVHLYIGEEAVAASVCSNLKDTDYITSTHRGHGHCIAKGADLGKAMAELMGRGTGYCKGRGGSMHIADFT